VIWFVFPPPPLIKAQFSQTFLVSNIIPVLLKILQGKLKHAISFTDNITIPVVNSFITLKFKRQSFFGFVLEI